MNTPADTAMPPVTETAAGEPRRLGVELEFSGLEIDTIAALMQEVLGGRLSPISDYEIELTETEFGTYRVELDMDYLKRLGRAINEEPDKVDRLKRWTGEVLGDVAQHITPHEIVTPPMPMRAYGSLNTLVGKLREAGARGTHGSPIYAYGLHLNPELPDTEAATLTAYIQAYACLSDWLAKRCDIDWSRRITPFIDRWPRAYDALVCAEDYAPDAHTLIADYLAHNPSRNRALDMLPAFCEVDEDQVRATVKDPLVKGRPALHYRLPNCLIDEPGWDLSAPWGDWLQVERLAHDHQRRAEMMAAYSEALNSRVSTLIGSWAGDSEQWLTDS